MSTELLISDDPFETRSALVQDGVLQEIHLERKIRKGILGNIYKGRVTRVVPSMQAAFVEIGIEKPVFLHVSNIVSRKEVAPKHQRSDSQVPSISLKVEEGQHLLVQIIKEPVGTKGASVTTDITIPSNYLIFVPYSHHIGISQKITNPEKRSCLEQCLAKYVDEKGGFIVRTAAQDIPLSVLEQEAVALRDLWEKITQKRREIKDFALLYADVPLPVKILRDFGYCNIEKILVDSPDLFLQFRDSFQRLFSQLNCGLTLYEQSLPLFKMFDVEGQIEDALKKEVLLDCGGYLVIEQTEALTTIDVNTGALAGKYDQEEIFLTTNLEAATVIAQQLRLRNLGGIIVVDFIDMRSKKNQALVLTRLKEQLDQQREKSYVFGFSPLGLVEINRKRVTESLEHTLCSSCPHCQGRGSVLSIETVCGRIIRKIIWLHREYKTRNMLVSASGEVLSYLNENARQILNQTTAELGIDLSLQKKDCAVDHFEVSII